MEDEEDAYNFEDGSNQRMESQSDVGGGGTEEAFQEMVDGYAHFDEHFAHMSIKQKTSYFVSRFAFLFTLL